MLDVLCDLTSDGELGDQNLALIYSKDLMVNRQATPVQESLAEFMKDPPKDQEITDVMLTRQK